MPKIPQFESGVREARTQTGGGGVQAPRLTNPAEQQARSQLAREGEEAVNLAIKIKEKEIQKASTLAVTNAQLAYMDIEDQILFGKDGFMYDKGAQAMRNHQFAVRDLEKEADDIMKNLTPRARDSFKNQYAKLRQNSRRVMNRHLAIEGRNAVTSSQQALIKNLVERSKRQAGDFKETKESYKGVAKAVDQIAFNEGMDREQRNLFLRNTKSAFAEANISAVIQSGDPVLAKKRFDYFKKDLNHDVMVRLKEDVDEGMARASALANFNAILKAKGDNSQEVTTAIENIKDPREKQLTVDLWDKYRKNVRDRQKRIRADRLEVVMDKFTAEIDRVGYVADPLQVGGSDYLKLNVKDRGTALDSARSATQTNEKASNEYHALKIEDMIKMDRLDFIKNYASKFSVDDRKEALERFRKAKSYRGKKIPGSERLADIVETRLGNMKYISFDSKGKVKKNDKQVVGRVVKAVNGLVADMQSRQEKITLNEMWEKALDKLIIEKGSRLMVDESFIPFASDTEYPAAVLTDKQIENITVPTAENIRLGKYIKMKLGDSYVTDENIRRLFHARKIGAKIPLNQLLVPEE